MIEVWKLLVICILVLSPSSINGDTDPSDGQQLSTSLLSSYLSLIWGFWERLCFTFSASSLAISAFFWGKNGFFVSIISCPESVGYVC